MASEIKRRFTDTEMQIVRETDLLELLTHLGYQVKRIGRYHTTAEMDSLRIKDRRTWFRYSQNTGGDAITLVQQFCDKTFPEAVEYLLTFNGRARDSPAKAVPSVKRDEVQKPFMMTCALSRWRETAADGTLWCLRTALMKSRNGRCIRSAAVFRNRSLGVKASVKCRDI